MSHTTSHIVSLNFFLLWLIFWHFSFVLFRRQKWKIGETIFSFTSTSKWKKSTKLPSSVSSLSSSLPTLSLSSSCRNCRVVGFRSKIAFSFSFAKSSLNFRRQMAVGQLYLIKVIEKKPVSKNLKHWRIWHHLNSLNKKVAYPPLVPPRK